MPRSRQCGTLDYVKHKSTNGGTGVEWHASDAQHHRRGEQMEIRRMEAAVVMIGGTAGQPSTMFVSLGGGCGI